MADSEEALSLRRRARRRLVGAIALVLALVIVPPWIMDLEPKPVVTNLSVEIPKQESAGLKPPPAPPAVGAPASPPEQAPSVPEAKPDAAAPKREAAKPAPKAESVPRTSAPDAVRKEAEAKRAESILNAEAYVISVGSFTSKENAKQVETKLAKAGVKHYSESVATSNGEQTRVRAGPYPTKAAAESSRDKLKSLGLDPGPVTAR
jgi:DedD protein